MTPTEEQIASYRYRRDRAVSQAVKADLDRRLALLVKTWRAYGGKLKLVETKK